MSLILGVLPTPAPGTGYYYVPAAHLSGHDPVWAQDNRWAPERARSGGVAGVRAVASRPAAPPSPLPFPRPGRRHEASAAENAPAFSDWNNSRHAQPLTLMGSRPRLSTALDLCKEATR